MIKKNNIAQTQTHTHKKTLDTSHSKRIFFKGVSSLKNPLFFFTPRHHRCTNPRGIRNVFLFFFGCVQTVAPAAQRRRRCGTTGWSVWTTWPPLSSNWSSSPRRCRRAGTFWPWSQTALRPSSGRERWLPCVCAGFVGEAPPVWLTRKVLCLRPTTGHFSFHRDVFTFVFMQWGAESKGQLHKSKAEKLEK